MNFKSRTTGRSPNSRTDIITSMVAGGLLLSVILFALSGCATHFDRVEPIRTAFFDGNLSAADEHLEKVLKKHKAERDVLLLDKSIIELAAGRPKEAERLLRQVRDRFDELEDFDATKAVASMLTDDNARARSRRANVLEFDPDLVCIR